MNRSPSLYTRLVAGLFFPLQEKLKQHTSLQRLAQLEKSQYLPLEQLNKLQLDNLRAFLNRLDQHNRYFSELFRSIQFDVNSIKSVSDLTKLPIQSKQDIRKNTVTLTSSTNERLVQYNTGGSSGEPLIFYMGKERISHDVAAKWRATRWWGVDIGDREAVIWGSPIELAKQDRFKEVRDRLFRSHLIPAFDLRPESISGHLQQLQQLRPRMVFGYPSVIHLLAQAAESQQIDLTRLGTQVVFTTSEMLYPHQRDAIESTFAAPVANGYGARDAGFIAHQCPAGAMHISAEDIIVEIVDEAGFPCPPDVAGEIVITHTATAAFPFLRYRTGDIGAISEETCSCGRTLPILKEVQGRTTDFITATDGTKVHALALIYILRELPGIEQFRIIQDEPACIQIELKLSPNFEHAHQERIIVGMKARLGENMRVKLRQVHDFPALSNGKFRYVENKLAFRT